MIVGGGAGGLELATTLGNKFGKGDRVTVTLIERNRSHVWKPKLHEIAAGSMDIDAHDVDYLAQSHWHRFTYRIGDDWARSQKRARCSSRAIRRRGPARHAVAALRLRQLIISIGSQSNDFGTPGVSEHAIKLETAADARRFNRRLINAAFRANAQAEPLRPDQLHVAIIGAGATGVELSAELHRTTRELIAYGLDRIDADKDSSCT